MTRGPRSRARSLRDHDQTRGDGSNTKRRRCLRQARRPPRHRRRCGRHRGGAKGEAAIESAARWNVVAGLCPDDRELAEAGGSDVLVPHSRIVSRMTASNWSASRAHAGAANPVAGTCQAVLDRYGPSGRVPGGPSTSIPCFAASAATAAISSSVGGLCGGGSSGRSAGRLAATTKRSNSPGVQTASQRAARSLSTR